jgi:hypothetical protein
MRGLGFILGLRFRCETFPENALRKDRSRHNKSGFLTSNEVYDEAAGPAVPTGSGFPYLHNPPTYL